MVVADLDKLISKAVGRRDPKLSRELAGTLKNTGVLVDLHNFSNEIAETLHDENLNPAARSKVERTRSIVSLLISFFSTESDEERKEILGTLKEIRRSEPVLKRDRTVEQWDKESEGDPEYAAASKQGEEVKRRFLLRYRELKSKSGIRTQEDLAQKTGISQSYISAIESGRHRPQFKTLEKLAKAFGVEVSAFGE